MVEQLCGSGLLLGERGESQVGLDDAEVREKCLCLLVLDAGVNNDVITRNPVDGGGDPVLVAGLQAVEDTEDLGGVAASGGGVRQNETDGLLGVDDEDRADGERNALGVDVGGVLVVDHVVGKRNLALLVADDGELQLGAGDLIDVLDPALMAVDGVGRETNELCAALGELRLELGECTELGGADGGVVLGVGEENDPVVADELVEVDGALGGLGLEVRGSAAQTESLSRHCDFYAASLAMRLAEVRGGGVAWGNVRASNERAREVVLQKMCWCLEDGYLKCNCCDGIGK